MNKTPRPNKGEFMKQDKILLLAFCVLLLLSISGCQNAATPAASPTQISYPTPLQPTNPPQMAYPSSTEQITPTDTAYSAPVDTVVSPSAYPVPEDGSTISWADAEQMILKGEVTGVIQTQSLDVTLTLKTGQTVKTTAPAADAVKNAISTCGDPCKDISVTTQ
jgi:hypothetical protein